MEHPFFVDNQEPEFLIKSFFYVRFNNIKQANERGLPTLKEFHKRLETFLKENEAELYMVTSACSVFNRL
jgi:hypothetical protein